MNATLWFIHCKLWNSDNYSNFAELLVDLPMLCQVPAFWPGGYILVAIHLGHNYLAWKASITIDFCETLHREARAVSPNFKLYSRNNYYSRKYHNIVTKYIDTQLCTDNSSIILGLRIPRPYSGLSELKPTFVVLKTRCHCVTLAGLKLPVLLPQCPEC